MSVILGPLGARIQDGLQRGFPPKPKGLFIVEDFDASTFDPYIGQADGTVMKLAEHVGREAFFKAQRTEGTHWLDDPTYGVSDEGWVAAFAAADLKKVKLSAQSVTVATPVSLPPGASLEGEGFGTQLTYYNDGTGTMLTVGTGIAALHSRGRINNLTVVLEGDPSLNASTAFQLKGTQGVSMRDVYVEGPLYYLDGSGEPVFLNAGQLAARTNEGVFIDGGNISGFFNKLDSVHTNHCHVGFRFGSTGSQRCTGQVVINCTAFGDFLAGDTTSIGMSFDDLSSDVTVFGGNVENCNKGMYIDGKSIVVIGTRFEIDGSAHSAIHFGPNSENCRVYACPDLHRTQVIDDGTNNKVYYLDETTELTAPTLLNGWVAMGGSYENPGYFRDAEGRIHLQGMMKSGTMTFGTTLFQLPAGYRPSADIIFSAVVDDVHTPISISSGGNVQLFKALPSNGYLSISGISFQPA